MILVGIASFAVLFLAGTVSMSLGWFTGIILLFGVGYKRYLYSSQKEKQVQDEEKQETEDSLSFALENGGKIINYNPYRGIFICGSAGSGKSATFFVPLINQVVERGWAGCIYDYKSPTLAEYVQGAAKRAGRTKSCYFVSFGDVEKSHRVNPLSEVVDSYQARSFAKILFANLSREKENFFQNSAIAFLGATIHYFAKHRPEYCTLPHVIAFLTNVPYNEIINVLASDVEIRMSAKSVIEGSDAKDQTAGVESSLLLPLGTLVDKKSFWVFSGDDLDMNLNEPGHEKILTIGSSTGGRHEALKPLIALAIGAAMKTLNEPGKSRSALIVDELPTLFLSDIETLPAVARSNRVATILGAQGVSQLLDSYGKEKTDTVLENLSCQYWGKANGYDTAKRVSDLGGKKDKVFQTQSINSGTSTGAKNFLALGRSSGKSWNETIQQRDRIEPERVLNLLPGEFLGFLSESNHTRCDSQFALSDYQTSPIRDVREVTPDMLEQNFRKNR